MFLYLVILCVCAVLFNRLYEMHLETESDGEGDFLAAFSYNPGDLDSVIHLELNRKTQKHCSVSWSVPSLSCVQRETVQKKTQTSVAVLMDDVCGPIWVRCASAILDLYWTTREHAVQVSVSADSQAQNPLLIFFWNWGHAPEINTFNHLQMYGQTSFKAPSLSLSLFL